MLDTALINLAGGPLWRKPRFLARAGRHYLSRRLLGRRQVTSVNIAFDYRCNLRCDHCFAETLKPRSERVLTLDDVALLADQAARLGCLNIGFQGGEPSVWPELPELIRAVEPRRFLINIYSNGLLLDRELLTRLKDAGLDLVCLSLDSGIPAEHDAFRRRWGTFDRVMTAIKLAREFGLLVKLAATVGHGSVFSDGFDALVGLARRHRIPTNLIIATPAGNWSGREDVLLAPEELARIEALCETDRLFYRDIHHHMGYAGCKAMDALYVTQAGDVLPCPFIHVAMGNVLDEPLADIVERGRMVPWFRKPAEICLAGERGPFMDQVLSRTWQSDAVPVPAGTALVESQTSQEGHCHEE